MGRPEWRARLRLRALSVAVLALVVTLSVVGCLVTHSVVRGQEHRFLKQRADEAALYLSTAIGSVQTQLASLAATAAATKMDPTTFAGSAKLLTAAPGGFASVALITTKPSVHVVSSTGSSLAGGLGPDRARAVEQAVAKVGLTGSVVATPIFTSSGARILGFAYASPTLADAVIYAESVLKSTKSSTTSGQPFSELRAVVYAGPHAQVGQILASTEPPGESIPGQTVTVTAPIGQGAPWLLVVGARHALVGSAATAMPWAILGAGLVAALLATAVVETLARRREFAMTLVDERTEELRHSMDDLAAAHDQLVRQERLAAIGQLASTVGHELRNPLAVINNAVFLLRSDLGAEPTEAAQRHLATAEREISAATVIVSDLLEFARQREPAVAPVDVTALVDEVLSVLPPPSGVGVTREPTAPGVSVNADRDMLRQVLINLVGNAYQAMPDGGHVRVGVVAQPGTVQFVVRDTGEGMSAEVQERLFEPFFTTKARGVGLGLAVSRRIVDAHGGQINVESEPNQGTEFRVTLPAIAAPRQPVEPTPVESRS